MHLKVFVFCHLLLQCEFVLISVLLVLMSLKWDIVVWLLWPLYKYIFTAIAS